MNNVDTGDVSVYMYLLSVVGLRNFSPTLFLFYIVVDVKHFVTLVLFLMTFYRLTKQSIHLENNLQISPSLICQRC